jgi:CHASE2 domain-containing sensor protein/class 3 adenylate cyclase
MSRIKLRKALIESCSDLYEWRRVSIALTLLVGFLSFRLPYSPFVELLENQSHDMRFTFRRQINPQDGERGDASPDAPHRIVYVTVDQETTEQWTEPQAFWNARYAHIIQQVYAQGATWVGLDILPEVDADGYLETIKAPAAQTRPDAALREEIVASGGRVVLPNLRFKGEAKNPAPAFILPETALNIGFMDQFPAPDGVIRQVPLFQRNTTGKALPSFPALVALRVREGYRHGEVASPDDEQWITSPASYRVLLPEARTLRQVSGVEEFYVNYGVTSTYEIPASRFDETDSAPNTLAQQDKKWLKGAVVLIGITYPGSGGYHRVPGDMTRPGVAIMGEAVGTLLSGRALHRLPLWAEALITLLAAWLSIGVLVGCTAKASRIAPCVVLLFALLHLLIVFVAFAWGDTLLPLTAPVAALILPGVLFYSIGFVEEALRRDYIMQHFGRMVSPQLATLATHRRRDPFQPDRQTNVILFFDLRDSTRITHLDGDPVAMHHDLNELFRLVAQTIENFGGIVYRYAGDGCIVGFGPPIVSANPDRDAVEAAVKIIRQVARANRQRRKEEKRPWIIGISVHRGKVSWGALGYEGRAEPTLIGDPINFCSRLEQFNKKKVNGEGDSCLTISEDVYFAAELGSRPLEGLPPPLREGGVPLVQLRDEPEEWYRLRIHQYFSPEEDL